ncbi:MAG: zinc transporter ZupT [Synergistota bacterium]|nr:zinc transporter ZupT [Synergistota bacterium]
MNEVLFAFGLTLFAGLATGVGSAIAFFADRTNYRFLSISTGFSAGVMLYVSFVEILLKGSESLEEAFGASRGEWVNTAFFFAGIALIGVIDYFIPTAENPHEPRSEEETAPLHEDSPKARKVRPPKGSDQEKGLMRTGLFTALAIGIHNFPEGLVTFLAALQDPKLGVAIAVAVALHNIPEGISVSVPIFYATGKRSKAFAYSLLSGMAEPVGALIAYGALRLFTGGEFSPAVTGALFAMVAGIMVYISLDELLPTSRAFGKGHDSLIGLVTGMAVMALSLLLM